MPIAHNGVLMRIYLTESRRSAHRPAHRAVLELLSTAGLAGATVFRGIEGFGPSHALSSERTVDALGDLPLLIEVADEEHKIRDALPAIEKVVARGLVTLERIQTILQHRIAEDAPR